MSLIYLTLIPAVCSSLWALYSKYQQHELTDLFLLSASSVAIIVNAIAVYFMVISDVTVVFHLMQMSAAAIIVPMLYTYFSRQVGKQQPDYTTVTLLWLVALVTFIPNIVIYNPFTEQSLPDYRFQPFALYYFTDGEKRFGIYTGDLASILQCVITIIRIIPFMFKLKQHNLHLNKKVYALGTCWATIIIFIIMVSSMSYPELRSTAGTLFYFFGYSIIIMFANFLIAKRYDHYPIETEHGEAVEDLGVYVQQQYSEMSSRLHDIMEKQELYLDPQLTAESVVEKLHTNRTYFSQMLSSDFGMSFSEYLNRLRLAHVEKLLQDDSLTITAVAQQSGFADAGYMSRKFKAKHGITPSEWRKQFTS